MPTMKLQNVSIILGKVFVPFIAVVDNHLNATPFMRKISLSKVQQKVVLHVSATFTANSALTLRINGYD